MVMASMVTFLPPHVIAGLVPAISIRWALPP